MTHLSIKQEDFLEGMECYSFKGSFQDFMELAQWLTESTPSFVIIPNKALQANKVDIDILFKEEKDYLYFKMRWHQ